MFTSFVNLKDKNTTHHFPAKYFFPASSVFSMDLIKCKENMNTAEDLKP